MERGSSQGKGDPFKPQTFMNLSGESVREAADFYKVDPEHIIVIYDDISLDVGRCASVRKAVQAAIMVLKNIIAHLGTRSFQGSRWA